jgi:hypothetical protein
MIIIYYVGGKKQELFVVSSSDERMFKKYPGGHFNQRQLAGFVSSCIGIPSKNIHQVSLS